MSCRVTSPLSGHWRRRQCLQNISDLTWRNVLQNAEDVKYWQNSFCHFTADTNFRWKAAGNNHNTYWPPCKTVSHKDATQYCQKIHKFQERHNFTWWNPGQKGGWDWLMTLQRGEAKVFVATAANSLKGEGATFSFNSQPHRLGPQNIHWFVA
jgi:hypothetical protein